jgi:hypothetical protein
MTWKQIARSCVLGGTALAMTRAAGADGLTDDDLWRYRSAALAIDAGVVAAPPAALEAGLSRGFAAGVTVGQRLFWGARASWATASETAIGWDVTHQDIKLRRLGGTLVHEARERIHGDIAGSNGMLGATSANALLPAADLDGVVSLHVTRSWMMMIAAGPSVTRVDHALRTGWNSYLGVAWQP